MRAPLLAVALLLSAFALQDPAPDAVALPEVGKPAPAFRLNDHEGAAVAVGGTARRWRVLAFYPKAATPGWTLEVCSLRDAADELANLEVDVYGISLDDVRTQAAFAAKHELGFGLLSDPDGSAARKYGVLMEGRPMARRLTFVIDGDGVLRHIDDRVDVRTHGADVAALIRRLRG